MRLAAVDAMRLPRHEGQNPRPLQLNATRWLSWHASHRNRREAPTEQAAVEVAVELLANERGQPDGEGPIVDRRVQRLEVVAHDLVEGRLLGAMTSVERLRRGEDSWHALRLARSAPAMPLMNLATFRRGDPSADGPALSADTLDASPSPPSASGVVRPTRAARGGCVTNVGGNPSCVHQVSGVSPTVTQFTACGTAPSEANWEIAVTNTDTSTLPPGAIWSNIQAEVNLANWSNFSPGTADWFSPCGGSSYAPSQYFAVYYQGTLVFANGIDAPVCRSPHGSNVVTGYTLPPTSTHVVPVAPTSVIQVNVGLPVRDLSGLETVINRCPRIH